VVFLVVFLAGLETQITILLVVEDDIFSLAVVEGLSFIPLSQVNLGTEVKLIGIHLGLNVENLVAGTRMMLIVTLVMLSICLNL
jgi:hypothetical protein